MNYRYLFIKNYLSQPVKYGNVFLHQIGTAYLEANTVVPSHNHLNFFELTIVTKGKGVITTNGIDSPVQANDIYLSFPSENHKIRSDKDDPIQYDFLAFSTDDERMSAELNKIAIINQRPEKRIIHNEVLKFLMPVIISECSQINPYQTEYLKALFVQILVLTIRMFNEQNTKSVRPTQNEEFCYQIMAYINAHIYTLNSLQELSAHFNYDYSYISNIFTKTTKQTLSDYFRFKRLERGRILIHENNLSLAKIAELLNYSSIYSFSKSFKQQYGMSPRNYKQKFIKNEHKTTP